MDGVKFVNYRDPLNRWTLDTVLYITQLIDEWCKTKGLKDVTLQRVEDNTYDDPANKRIDVEICYTNAKGFLVQQKLLILKGEVIDGETFHKRFSEFYPKEAILGGVS